MRFLFSVLVLLVLMVIQCKSQLNLSSGKLCFQSVRRNPKIVGGTNANIEETPFIVPLMRHGGNFCASSIIANRFLLTAGHCVCNNKNRILKPTQIKAFAGVENLLDLKTNDLGARSADHGIQEVFIEKIILHPEYICGKPEHDIAILELKFPIEFNRFAQPVCLATEESAGDYGVVSGWGYLNEKQEINGKPNQLQQAKVPFLENSECQESYRNEGQQNVISDGQLCAGYKQGGIDACFADSGGPLVSKFQGTLIGVVSTGVGCARPNLPGIYTRVSKYLTWIKSHVN